MPFFRLRLLRPAGAAAAIASIFIVVPRRTMVADDAADLERSLASIQSQLNVFMSVELKLIKKLQFSYY